MMKKGGKKGQVYGAIKVVGKGTGKKGGKK